MQTSTYVKIGAVVALSLVSSSPIKVALLGLSVVIYIFCTKFIK